MPKTRLISPGSIPNHKLLKNLQLQDNYISNDGDNQGISIADNGNTTLSSTGNQLRLAESGISYALLSHVSSDLTITTAQTGDITLDPNGTCIINEDNENTTTSSSTALQIDYDHTEIAASGQTVTGIGLDLDMHCNSVTHVGTVNQTGIDLDMVALTDGTQTNTGIDVTCSGGDTNTQLRLGYDGSNYSDISVASDGELTLATTGTDADIRLNPASDIFLHSTSFIWFQDTDSNQAYFKWNDSSTNVFRINHVNDVSNYLNIAVGANGATTIATADSDGAEGHLNIEPNGHVEFDGCAVGFDLVTPTYNATTTIVDFKTGNKQMVTFDGGNITHIQFHFPATSGNFVCLFKQDGTGSRTITNYKVFAADGLAATNGATKFAGGSNPTLTTDANHVDIISIFWDADNEVAYAVPSLDFQF